MPLEPVSPVGGDGAGRPACQRGLAHRKRFAAKIIPVQLDQVEGLEETLSPGHQSRIRSKLAMPSSPQETVSSFDDAGEFVQAGRAPRPSGGSRSVRSLPGRL